LNKNKRVEIYPSILELIMERLPKHKRNQDLTPIVNDFVYMALAGHDTLGKTNPSGVREREKGEVFTSTNIRNIEKEIKENSTNNQEWINERKKEAEDLNKHRFEEFWKTYQCSKNKAGQSKIRAKTEWEKAIKVAGSNQRLIEAAQRAIDEQTLQMNLKGESIMLPDCFRWLRDGKYEALLEEVDTHTQPRTRTLDNGLVVPITPVY
jgi:hypothetical protein